MLGGAGRLLSDPNMQLGPAGVIAAPTVIALAKKVAAGKKAIADATAMAKQCQVLLICLTT